MLFSASALKHQTESTDPEWLSGYAPYFPPVQVWNSIFFHNLMVSLRTVRKINYKKYQKLTYMRKVEKVGEGAKRIRGGGGGRSLHTKKTQGPEMVRFAVVWFGFGFVVWAFFFFKRQPILSFCSSVLCLVLYCPTAKYYCYTNM